VICLFSETLQRAVQNEMITQDMIDLYDPRYVGDRWWRQKLEIDAGDRRWGSLAEIGRPLIDSGI
jgi:hypothetical protein